MTQPLTETAKNTPSFAPERIDGGNAGLMSRPKAPLTGAYLFYGFCFKIRGLLAVILLFIMFLTTRGEAGSGFLNWAVGLTLFGAAFGLRIRSQQYLRYRLRDDSSLASTGPYAYVRNPVYIGNITALAGLCILCRLWWMAPIAALWAFLVYHGSVLFEEMRLAHRFGEPYRRYCERVPRWIPRSPVERSSGEDRASLWRAAGVEWQDLLLLLVPLGKGWGLLPNAGPIRATLARAVSFITTHQLSFAAALAAGLIALAALNLMRLRRVMKARGAKGPRVRNLICENEWNAHSYESPAIRAGRSNRW